MPNWHQSEISAAGGDAINSTSAFDHATHLEAQAYLANRWLFIAMMIVLGWCIFAQLPHTIIRMRWARSVWNGFRLRPPGPSEIMQNKKADAGSSAIAGTLDKAPLQTRPPRRLKHLHLSLPIYTIPFLDLPLPQFLVVVFSLALGLGVAGWCQAAFLTHASRSTLVIMAIMSLTAGFGVKAFGVGTWLQVGYTAVNFLHRWLGRLVLLLATLHVVAYLVVFYRAGGESIHGYTP
jgi:ferric-chelate reductase